MTKNEVCEAVLDGRSIRVVEFRGYSVKSLARGGSMGLYRLLADEALYEVVVSGGKDSLAPESVSYVTGDMVVAVDCSGWNRISNFGAQGRASRVEKLV